MVEVGIPYSDPIADGPVIAASYHRALERGVKLAHIFQTFRTLRAETADGPARRVAPLVTMVSYAIIHRQGVDRYLREAVDRRVRRPDRPRPAGRGVGGALPAGDRARPPADPAHHADHPPRPGRRGSPGRRPGSSTTSRSPGSPASARSLPPELAENVAWLRTQTDLPICIGFGISSPEQVRELAPVADGLIVGSALVRRLADAAEPAPGRGRRARSASSSASSPRASNDAASDRRRRASSVEAIEPDAAVADRQARSPEADPVGSDLVGREPLGDHDRAERRAAGGPGRGPRGSRARRGRGRPCSILPPVCSNHQARSLRSAWPEKPSRT